MGILITYSSYFNNKTHLIKTAGTVAILDTTVAILAGVIIFPAVFSYGVDPVAGPDLVFVTLPNVFNQMPVSALWSALFSYSSLAALTSTVSLFEVAVAFLSTTCISVKEKGNPDNDDHCCQTSTVCSLFLSVHGAIYAFLGKPYSMPAITSQLSSCCQ